MVFYKMREYGPQWVTTEDLKARNARDAARARRPDVYARARSTPEKVEKIREYAREYARARLENLRQNPEQLKAERKAAYARLKADPDRRAKAKAQLKEHLARVKADPTLREQHLKRRRERLRAKRQNPVERLISRMRARSRGALSHPESKTRTNSKYLLAWLPEDGTVEGFHIDHVLPIARVKKIPTALALASHWANLRLIPAEDNLAKKATLPTAAEWAEFKARREIAAAKAGLTVDRTVADALDRIHEELGKSFPVAKQGAPCDIDLAP